MASVAKLGLVCCSCLSRCLHWCVKMVWVGKSNSFLLTLTLLCILGTSSSFVEPPARIPRATTSLAAVTVDRSLLHDTTSRRDLIKDTSALALASVLLGFDPQSAGAVEQAPTGKTIVLTGANSGIGFEACKRLSSAGNTLVLACRNQVKADAAAEALRGFGGTIIPASCDLASMESISDFVTKLPSLISGNIDILCLNAGIARNTAATDVARTKDGFELTVGTNHFGHFYLNHLLLPKMNADSGRIVVTASGVHDPDSPGGAQGSPATLGDLRGLREDGKLFEMVDGSKFNADKAYKDSKLCNVLFAKELQRRVGANAKTQNIIVNSFNPGLIVSTGLFRDQNAVFTKLFDFAATDLLKVGESPAWGGGCLSYMTTVDSKGKYYSSPPGSSRYGDDAYGREFSVTETSKESQDETKAKDLWDLTEKLLELS